jgi:hypothetical protein
MRGKLRPPSKITKEWIAYGIAFLGGMAYLVQLWVYAHSQTPTLDEGTYLEKGYLFVRGVYKPFQPYGFWTNKTPLAFTIPGVIQVLFGEGLRSGRYFAIFLNVLMLAAIWILVRRLAGKLSAAFVVAAFALNPAWAKIYSTANSQILIACMLVWILALLMGRDRPIWQIILAGVLSGMLVMTRINMAPVPLFALGYVFWQHGRKPAILFLLSSAVVVVAGHALYWPNILQIWAPWLPAKITPFLNPWRLGVDGHPIWMANLSWISRVFSLFEGLRLNLILGLAVLAAWLAWSWRSRWKDDILYRAAIFLSALFAFLAVIHGAAALTDNYCVSCFAVYLQFFAPVGLILAAITFASWQPRLTALRQSAIALVVVASFAGLGFALNEEVGDALIHLQFPRVRSLQIMPGSIELWLLVVNKFGGDAEAVKQTLRQILPPIAGALIGGVFLGFAALVRVITRAVVGKKYPIASWGYFALIGWLAVGTILSPTPVMGADPRPHDCNGDVLASYEAAGRDLASKVSSGARVYLDLSVPTAVILYLHNPQIFPPQLNQGFSFYTSGDDDRLYRFGRWNESLARQWALQSDVVLIADNGYNAWWESIFEAGRFNEVQPTPPFSACDSRSFIHIYINQKKP